MADTNNDKRLIDDGIPQISTAPSVFVKVDIPNMEPSQDLPELGGNCIEYEFTAMLNGGEQVRAKFADPHFTIYKNFVGNNYFKYSRIGSLGPIQLESQIRWGANSTLKTTSQLHVVATMAPAGTTNQCNIELLAVDHPSYFLAAGDAGGGSYVGNITAVIQQVVQKYGKGWCLLEFDADTKDSKFNRWWQMRMDPKTFIVSLLDWTSSLADKQTRWMLYPDGETLIIKEQAAVQSQQRAVYEWRGFGGKPDKRTGDILEWEFIGDNALQMLNEQMVTSGMSSISGAYFDQSQYKEKQDVVFVGDLRTSNKYKPEVENTGRIGTSERMWKSYSKPLEDTSPLTESVGWTGISSIPEFSAGDLGLRYQDFIDGRARGAYLSSSSTLMRMRFRVMGHHIWSGSEGLGADTIYITISSSTEGGPPYFAAGNWIVYGFSHIYHPGSWVTDLYCYRLDKDAEAKAVGKNTEQ